MARKNLKLKIQGIKATKIQACVRGWLARKRYERIRNGFILLQAHFRRRQARKIYKTLKIEARSVEHQRQLNKGLENKIISLQQQIEKIVILISLLKYNFFFHKNCVFSSVSI